MEYFSSKIEEFDDDDFDKMREVFSPSHVDSLIRQAIQVCWMMLPKEKRNFEEVERQIRRMVDRAIENAREDSDAFSGGGEKGD